MIGKRILFYISFFAFIGVSLFLIIEFIDGIPSKIGFISILIAIISIILVVKSESLVTTIATANFLRIISQLEDKRLELDEGEFRGDPTFSFRENYNFIEIQLRKDIPDFSMPEINIPESEKYRWEKDLEKVIGPLEECYEIGE